MMARTNIIVYSLSYLDFYTKKHAAMFILKDFFCDFLSFHRRVNLVTNALFN